MKHLLALVLALLAASPSAAQTRQPVLPDVQFRDRLYELENDRKWDEVFVTANRASTREQLKAALDWMKIRATGQGTTRDPRFLLSYAALLQRAGINDMASAAYVTGMILAASEAERCADRTASVPKLAKLRGELRFLEDLFWSFPANQREDFVRYASLMDMTKSRGSAGTWLCMGGEVDTRKALELATREGRTDIVSERVINGVKTTVVDSSGIEPALLPDGETERARRETFRAWSTFYAQAERPKTDGPARQ